MRMLIIVVAALLVVVLFILQGFQQTHPLPEPDNNRQSTATGEATTIISLRMEKHPPFRF